MTAQTDLAALADRLRETIDTNMMDGTARRALHKIADELAARLPGDGWVMVPKSALEWLDGMGEDFECPPDLYFNGKPAPYWWGEEFRRRATAPPAAGIGWRL